MRTDSASAAEVGIGTILSALWRRKLVILAFTVLGLGAAVTLLAVLPPRYTSSVSILLDPKGPDATTGDGQYTAHPVDTVKIGSVVSVITSNELLDSVVRDQHLIDDPDFKPQPTLASFLIGLLQTTGPAPAPDGSPDAAAVARATEMLRQATTVTRDGFTYVVKIEVSSRDAAKARRLAQAEADTYIAKQLDAKEEATRRSLNWLTARLKQLNGDQMASEAEVESVRRTFGLAENDGGATPVTTQQINDLSKEIVLAQADLTQKKSRADLVAKLRAGGADLQSFPEVGGSQVITQLRQRLAESISKLSEQTQLYGARHPGVIQADNDRQSIQTQLDAEVDRIIANVANDYEVALQRQQALQDQLTRLKDEEGRGAEGRSRLRQAQRLAQANRQLFDLTLARFKEVEQRQTLGEGAEARIISAAVLPQGPSFPKPILLLVGGLGLGVALGCGCAFLLEKGDRTFSTPVQIENLVGVPVLATVPRMRRGELVQGDRSASLVDYTARNPLSLWAECLRSIRTGLCDQLGKTPRIIQFTSPMPHEGKSTIAASVAVSAAMAGLRTILIDCDFRNPTATRIFNCEARIGAADVLLGSASLAEAVVATPIPLLSIVPAGTNAGSLPDVANLDSMMRLVLGAIEAADLVFIDSAAVEVVADAATIAQVVDRTIMVVKWRSSDRHVVARSVGRLARANGRLAGIVLNDVDLRAVARYGYVSRAHIRQIGRYYRVRGASPVTSPPVQTMLSHSTAQSVVLACLTMVLSAVGVR